MLRVVYLVSGDDDIRPSHQVLRDAGRSVRHDDEVGPVAREVLTADAPSLYVVIAHGTEEGTVQLYRSEDRVTIRWLWVGMPDPPRAVRLHLYCCNVGPHLVEALQDCQLLGYSGPVPMPVDEYETSVLEFLDEVDSLLADEGIDIATCRVRLSEFLDRRFGELTDRVDSEFADVMVYYRLRKSLQ